MTLIVSEVSRHGIAMAADSAVTSNPALELRLESGRPAPPVIRTGAQKIIPLWPINAAIACWGFGAVGPHDNPNAQIPVDTFLIDFAGTVQETESLDDVGRRLVDVLNRRIPVGRRGGFHLAGFTEDQGRRFPALYHIHTGPNAQGPHGPLVLYRDAPYGQNPHISIDQWLAYIETGGFYWIRNGEFGVYAHFSARLNQLMEELQREERFVCPDPAKFRTPLEGRGRFLKLQVQTICEFYRLSNRIDSIAQPISWVTINPERIERFEPIETSGLQPRID